MKKYLLVSLTVLFAIAFLWADDVVNAEQKVGIEGDATVKWGVELGKGTGGDAESRGVKHGFKNEASWKVTFPLLKKGNAPSKRPENADVYAEVELNEIELGFESKHDSKDFKTTGKVKEISGKLVFYGAYLKVYDKPSFKTNYAGLFPPIEADNYSDGFKFEPGFEGAGFTLGYAGKNLKGLDVGLKFGSNGDWGSKAETKSEEKYNGSIAIHSTSPEATVPAGEKWYRNGKFYDAGAAIEKPAAAGDAPYIYDTYKVSASSTGGHHSKYGIGFDFAMKPLDDMLGIKLGVNSTFNIAKDKGTTKGYNRGVGDHTNDSVAFGIGAELTSKPVNGLSLKLGFDGGSKFAMSDANAILNGYANKDKKPGFAWDLIFDTQYKWIGGGVYVASAGTAYHGYNYSGTDPSKMNNNTADMAAYLKFHTKGGKDDASNLVEGLDAGAYIGLYDLLSKPPKDPKTQLPVLAKLWGSYKANINDSMWIKPYAHFWAETNHWAQSNNTTVTKPYIGVAYDLGVVYSPVEKVEIEAKWAHGKTAVNQNPDRSGGKVISANANKKNHNGTFVLGLKVKY